MDAAERRQYLRWWKRLGWWLFFWLCSLLVVACIVASPGKVFGDLSDLFTVAYLGFMYGAVTSPVMAFGFWVASRIRKTTQTINEELRPWIPDGIHWRIFWLVVIGGPALSAAVCWNLAHTFEVLSMLAGIDAVLIVAVVVDTRSMFELVGVGGSRRTQTTLRLALLWAITFGMILAASGAIIAKSTPPPGVHFGLALTLSVGYGLFSGVAAVMLLTLNASARLVEAHADMRRRASDDSADSGAAGRD